MKRWEPRRNRKRQYILILCGLAILFWIDYMVLMYALQ